MGNDQAHLGMPKWMGSVTKMGWVMNLFFFFVWDYSYTEVKKWFRYNLYGYNGACSSMFDVLG